MKILFLGDVVGISGCSKIMTNLLDQVKMNQIDFVIVNGENADVYVADLNEPLNMDNITFKRVEEPHTLLSQ